MLVSYLHRFLNYHADSSDVLKYLLPFLSSSGLTAVNENGSPPLHWAIMNNHVAIVQLLIEVPEEKGGGVPLLKVRFLHSCFRSRASGLTM